MMMLHPGMTTHANTRGGWSRQTRDRSRFDFLGDLFPFNLFLGLRCTSTGRPIVTIYMSHDVIPCKNVPFGSLINATPYLVGEIP